MNEEQAIRANESQPRILIIDDEESVRMSLATILKKSGYDVFISSNGEEGIRHVEKYNFDLVITDLKMHGMDGIKVLEQVKAISPDTLVIIITGYASLESAVAAIRKGASDYLVKPFQIDVLKLVVKRSVEIKNLTEKNKALLLNLQEKNEELAQKNEELRATQEKLLEAERITAISETIAALHHEVNNPLMAMLGKVQLLRDSMDTSDSRLSNDLEIMEKLTLRVASIIEKMKHLTRPISKKYVEKIAMLDLEESD